MKKKYIMPLMDEMESEMQLCLLAGSPISSENGIGYGGIDINGELEPEGKDLTDAEIW